MDIEDIAEFGRLYKIAYDDENKREIIDKFLLDNLHIRTWKKLEKQMKEFQRIHKFAFRKTDLVASYKRQSIQEPDFYKVILKKAMRSQSGVLVVTVFTDSQPEYTDKKTGIRKKQTFSCKHNCYYCTLEPAREENGWKEQPRSYDRFEPGVARANILKFDCTAQVHLRIAQYMRMGHDVDKLEVLVLGGTFSEYPEEYQYEFVRDIYYASNTALGNHRKERFPLETEILLNETANVRVIGLTLETRPDTITLDEIKKFREFGCTRVQMGMQHTDDKILKLSNRGHTLKETRNAIKLLKDNCFKLDLHVMPNLFGSSPEKDKQMLDQVLYDPSIQADQLKLYPVSVLRWTVYEKWFNEGKYKPYSDEKLKEVLLYVMRKMHPWIRLNRIIRDIPSQSILGGCNVPHMRQELDKVSNCKDIRSREVKGKIIGEHYRKVRKYESSGGTEIFISYESKDEKIIYGFIRLRIPWRINEKDKETLPEMKDSAFVRELHTYGSVSKVGEKRGSQHRGIGSKLLKDAEFYALMNGYNSLVCISGIGVREYYRKRGYTITTSHGYVKKNILPYPIHLIYNILVKFLVFIYIRIYELKFA
tara:strand:+ start:86 stop:1858 length:1773 start_codon:yes stop_codon:yes gene_type:complete